MSFSIVEYSTLSFSAMSISRKVKVGTDAQPLHGSGNELLDTLTIHLKLGFRYLVGVVEPQYFLIKGQKYCTRSLLSRSIDIYRDIYPESRSKVKKEPPLQYT